MSWIAERYGYENVPERFTRKQVLRVIKSHHADLTEFDAEYPLAESYDADVVLAWLGY